MANAILVIGQSGSGKSTAIEPLDPKSTFIICSDEKGLPFKSWKAKYTYLTKDNPNGNYIETSVPAEIRRILDHIDKNRPDIKTVVIDTINHVMTSEFMRTARVQGYGKYTELALDVYQICKMPPKMRRDLTVIFNGHNEVAFDANGNKINKLRTIGKLLDEKINVESLFTYVFFAEVKRVESHNEYFFSTQSDGTNTAKTPRGCFDEFLIPNDFKAIIDRIEVYENEN